MKKHKIGSKPPLVQNLLLVEGITRAGKFLLANLLTAIRDIEPMQYKNNLEIMPYLLANGLIDKAVAQELIRCEVDINSYEMLIGRNFNLRKSDKSSIFNHPSYKQYLNRSDVENREDLVSEGLKKSPYFLYILHESLPNIQLLFDTFPKLKLISLRRDPVELVYSWYQRGHGSRWGSDPVLFQVPFYHKRGPIPWFAIDWADDYYRMSEIDRVIKSILFLWQKSELSYQSIKQKYPHQILRLRYELLLQQPKQQVAAISAFLNKPTESWLKTVLKQERLPNQDDRKLAFKLEKIQSLSAIPELISQLTRTAKVYEQSTTV